MSPSRFCSKTDFHKNNLSNGSVKFVTLDPWKKFVSSTGPSFKTSPMNVVNVEVEATNLYDDIYGIHYFHREVIFEGRSLPHFCIPGLLCSNRRLVFPFTTETFIDPELSAVQHSLFSVLIKCEVAGQTNVRDLTWTERMQCLAPQRVWIFPLNNIVSGEFPR